MIVNSEFGITWKGNGRGLIYNALEFLVGALTEHTPGDWMCVPTEVQIGHPQNACQTEFVPYHDLVG